QCRQPLRQRLLSPSVARGLQGDEPPCAMTTAYNAPTSDGTLSRMIQADLSVTIPDGYLVKIDRASMYYGLELRPPLLDHKLLEFAAKMPSERKVSRGMTKWTFKKSQEGRLPRETLTRPKQGFVIPVEQWMRAKTPLSTYFSETALNGNSTVGRFVDPKV